MNIKFKKLHPQAVLPIHQNEGDAGLDLTTVDAKMTEYGTMRHYFGLAVEIPPGNVGLLFMRSSVYKTDQTFSNAVGVIDSGYRGELMADFRPADSYASGSEDPKPYEVGERTAQLVIIPVRTIISEWSDTLSESERGESGHGSTNTPIIPSTTLTTW